MDLTHLFSIEGFFALLTLAFLEIVLGIDNIIFISIAAEKLPANKRVRARNLGLALSLILRLGLLASITWLMKLNSPFMELWGFAVSGKDLILAFGGLFLLWKSAGEIHNKISGEEHSNKVSVKSGVASVIFQIVLIDLIFSFDSILTAVGITENLPVMMIAVVIAVIIMMLFSTAVSNFIHKVPTIQILALAFLILIGVMLIMEAGHQHVPKGYIYFAVFFSLTVEMINLKIRKKHEKKKLANTGK